MEEREKKGIQGRGVERRGIVGGEGEKRDTGERDREEWRVVDARNYFTLLQTDGSR